MRLALFIAMLHSAGLADILINFDQPNSLNNNFYGPTAGFTIIETPDGGLANTRGVKLGNADFPQIRVYKQQGFAGDSHWKLGAYVLTKGTEPGIFSFGLVNDPNAWVNNGSSSSLWVQPTAPSSVGVALNAMGSLHIMSDAAIVANSPRLPPLEGWHYIQTECQTVDGLLSLSVSVFSADGLGNVDSQFWPTFSASISNPLIAAPGSGNYFFFGTSDSGPSTLDNFQIQIIPEPSAPSLLALLASAFALRHTRRRLLG